MLHISDIPGAAAQWANSTGPPDEKHFAWIQVKRLSDYVTSLQRSVFSTAILKKTWLQTAGLWKEIVPLNSRFSSGWIP